MGTILASLARYGLTGIAAWYGWGLRWAVIVAATVAIEEIVDILSRRATRLEREGRSSSMGARAAFLIPISIAWGTGVMFVVYGIEYWIIAWIAGQPLRL